MFRYARSLVTAIFLFACLTAPPAIAGGNPMEFVGIEHNRYADCLLKQQAATESELVRILVERCGFDPGMTVEQFEERYLAVLDERSSGDIGLVESLGQYRSRFSAAELSLLAEADAVLQQETSVAEAQLRLETIERKAVQTLDADTRSGQAVLAGIATARYSLNFWADAVGDAGISARNLWPLVRPDIEGGVIGLELGGPWGAVFVGAVFSISAYLE